VGFGFAPWRSGGLISYAEDIMEGQLAGGHEVAYFFRGRHFPLLPDDRLRAWSCRGVRMLELLNSSLGRGEEAGTLTPEADLNHAPSERSFLRALDQFQPAVVHFQELMGLPSSLVDLARARGLPVVATVQDYALLCPVLKLYDVDGQLCLRQDVGAQCARCCAWAPDNRRAFRYMTVQHEISRIVGPKRAERGMARVRDATGRGVSERADPPRERAPSADAYQARRDVNLARLGRVDALVAQSHRLAEILEQLGVDPGRTSVMQFTLAHLAELTPRRIARPPGHVRFVTLNSAVSRPKGSKLLAGAVAELRAAGLAGRFTLTVLGPCSEEAARELGRFDETVLHGPYLTRELDRLLEGHHVGLVPSVWEEAYGYVGPELLAKGIPVIGNARGGIPEYTRDGETGWLNRDVTPAGLAAVMAGVIERPGEICERNDWILEHRSELIKPLGEHLKELDELYRGLVAA